MSRRPGTAASRKDAENKENAVNPSQFITHPSMFPIKDEPKHKDFGKLPRYISKFKEEQADAKMRKAE